MHFSINSIFYWWLLRKVIFNAHKISIDGALCRMTRNDKKKYCNRQQKMNKLWAKWYWIIMRVIGSVIHLQLITKPPPMPRTITLILYERRKLDVYFESLSLASSSKCVAHYYVNRITYTQRSLCAVFLKPVWLHSRLGSALSRWSSCEWM